MRLQQARPMTPEELRSTGSKPDVSEGAEAHAEGWPDSCPTCKRAFGAAPPSAPDPEPCVGSCDYFEAPHWHRSPDPEGLPSVDVERLARAFEEVTGEDADVSVLWWPERLRDGGQGTQRDFATALAAEYARLSPVEQGTEPTE